MMKYFVSWNGALDVFDVRELAELVYDSRFDAGVSPLFLIVADETTGDCKVDQWILD